VPVDRVLARRAALHPKLGAAGAAVEEPGDVQLGSVLLVLQLGQQQLCNVTQQGRRAAWRGGVARFAGEVDGS